MPATIKRLEQNSNVYRAHGIMSRHKAQPSSPSIFGQLGESIEIRAHARDLRLCMEAENVSGGANRQNLAKPIPAKFRYLHPRIDPQRRGQPQMEFGTI